MAQPDFTYDQVPYDNHAFPHTHPDHLAALGKLFGLSPSDIRRCSVLELGCGDGGNLIPMAYGLPESEFVGIDLSARAIEAGNTTIRELGLTNIRLIHRDILDIPDDGAAEGDIGAFDYIIAHGVLSWVPEPVREKMFRLFSHRLRENGIVYLSYNALPGGYLNRVVNDAMRFHTRTVPQPEERNRQALAVLQFLCEAARPEDDYGAVLTSQLKRLSEAKPHSLNNRIFHDRIAEINQAFYFSEVIARAGQHGLCFLAEADFSEMQDIFLAPEIRRTLQHLSGGSLVRKEQWLDFIKGRKFRKTLLCRKEAPIDRRIGPARMADGFYFSSRAEVLDAADKPIDVGAMSDAELGKLLDDENPAFRSSEGMRISTEKRLPRLALLALRRRWPARLGMDDILALAETFGVVVTDEERAALHEILFTGFSGGMVGLHVDAPAMASVPGERPKASDYARLQAARASIKASGTASGRVTGLLHTTVDIENSYAPVLIPLMDGSRTLEEIRAAAVEAIRERGIPFNGKSTEEKSDAELRSEIDREMTACTRYGLLIR